MTDLLLYAAQVSLAVAAVYFLVGLLAGLFDFTDAAMVLLGAAAVHAQLAVLACLIGLTATALT